MSEQSGQQLKMEAEKPVPGEMRIAVSVTDASANTLINALHAVPDTSVHSLNWPPSLTSLTADIGSGQESPSPDLVICEIENSSEATNQYQTLAALWPEALLVSCENTSACSSCPTPMLGLASHKAGYHDHLRIEEARFHVPLLLRYAAQRRQNKARLERLERVVNAFSSILLSLDVQRVAAAIIQEFSQWISADAWLLYSIAENGRSLDLVLAEGLRIRPHSLKLSLSLPTFENTAPHLLKMPGEMMAAHSQFAEPINAESLVESVIAENGHSQSMVLCLPLIVEEKAVGVIKAIRHTGNFEKPDEQLLEEMSRIASIALNNAMRYEQAERMYMQDDLTQLYNSRYLRQFIDREIKRAQRYGSSFSVIFIDIDGFKEVNDRYGHRVGSETLCEVANLLMESVRDTDVVSRYGGDEFTIVLPETSAEQALLTAERIRQGLAEHLFSGGGKNKFRLTASFGVAAFPEHAQNAADLLEKADLAMYEAKAVGKNKAKLSNDASESRVPVLM